MYGSFPTKDYRSSSCAENHFVRVNKMVTPYSVPSFFHRSHTPPTRMSDAAELDAPKEVQGFHQIGPP